MLTLPQNVNQLQRFLGMVQYYRDLWARRREMRSSLTNLVGECGHIKATRATRTRHMPWHWDDMHQTAFDIKKTAIAKDIVWAYPDYSQGFEIYTDSSKFQLGAIITQNNLPLAFFSHKLNTAQQKYSMTKQELLDIVETITDLKFILWGQTLLFT